MSIPAGAAKLGAFLKRARESIGSAPNVRAVVGNEAADLDSMASAVLYAYFRAATDTNTSNAYIPLINIPRADFKLRTEAVYLFEQAGIDPATLIFADEFDPATIAKKREVSLILVDHNRPTGALTQLEDRVVGVVDHHADEGLFTDAEVRMIEPVGSAATLVAEAMMAGDPALIEDGAASLLVGTILLDTVNMDPDAKRVTPRDKAIAEKLLARTGANQQELFDALQREKFNVSTLNSADLLRKDYKEWTLGGVQLGISSVLLPIDDWLEKDPDLPGSLATFAKKRKLDVLLSMNAFTSPSFTRELVVYCADKELRERVVAFLEASELQLNRKPGDGVDPSTALYAQGNVAISRKKLQPLLAAFFGANA